jgi:hypothetical protein
MLKCFNKFRRARKSVTPVGVADYAFGSIRPTSLICTSGKINIAS